MFRALICLAFFLTSCSSIYIPAKEPKPVVKAKKKVVYNKSKSFSRVKVKPYSSSQDERFQDIATPLLSEVNYAVPEQASIVDSFVRNAKEYQVNPLLMLALARKTSSLNSSYQGEDGYGLIPLSAKQAKFIAGLYNLPYISQEDLLVVDNNLQHAFATFKFLKELFNNSDEQALIAYHWGIDPTEKFLNSTRSLPAKEKTFLNSVLNEYAELQKLDANKLKIPEEKLEEEEAAPNPENTKLMPQKDSAAFTADYFVSPSIDSEPYAKFIASRIANKTKIPNPEVLAAEITQKSILYGFNPLIITALIEQGSLYSPRLEIDNRIGLLQINEDEAPYMAQISKVEWIPSKLKNTDYNLKLGLRSLATCHDVFEKDVNSSLAAYYWGIKKLLQALKTQNTIPEDVSRFPKSVYQDYLGLKKTYQDFIAEEKVELAKVSESEEIKNAAEELKETGPTVSEKEESLSLPSNTLTGTLCPSKVEDPACLLIAQQIERNAAQVSLDPRILAVLARITSNVEPELIKYYPKRFGLYQFNEEMIDNAVVETGVSLTNNNQLLNSNFATNLAAKYLAKLDASFRGELKHIIAAFFLSAGEVNAVINARKSLPNDVNSKVAEFMKLYEQ